MWKSGLYVCSVAGRLRIAPFLYSLRRTKSVRLPRDHASCHRKQRMIHSKPAQPLSPIRAPHRLDLPGATVSGIDFLKLFFRFRSQVVVTLEAVRMPDFRQNTISILDFSLRRTLRQSE